ncbi:MAG: glycosyltransferase family 87 protein [Myxococcota bacterium]
MAPGARSFGILIAACAIAWHVLSVLSPAWVVTGDQQQARDFASYFYAVRVARDGGDPYDRAQLNLASKTDGTRRGVHPFLYAPPFLLGMSWVLGFDLAGAFHLWFWLDELLAIASGIVLWRWWRGLDEEGALPVGWVIVVVMSLMTAIPNNHAMGQANFPGLVLALAGLWQTDRGKPQLGGALMGAACMMKMSPALFLVYWAIRREWTAIGAAILAGVALSVLSLPFAGPVVQWGFYTHVLPTFSSGDYNGLAVPIELFGNHSLPNVLDAILPSPSDTLSVGAQLLSGMVSVGALVALAAWFRTPPDAPAPDAFTRAAQSSCFGVLLLLIPVYTYEHHLVFAIPAAVLAITAVSTGRLSPAWAVPVGLCVTILVFDLQVLKAMAEAIPPGLSVLAAVVREAKFAALLGLLAATERVGHQAAPAFVAVPSGGAGTAGAAGASAGTGAAGAGAAGSGTAA